MEKTAEYLEAQLEVFAPDVWTVRPSTFGEFDPIAAEKILREAWNRRAPLQTEGEQ